MSADTSVTPAPVLQTEHLSLCLGARVLLDDVNLTLPARGADVLIGPRGAGKTLLLRVLAGAPLGTGPDEAMPEISGEVRMGGRALAPDWRPQLVRHPPDLVHLLVGEALMSHQQASAGVPRRASNASVAQEALRAHGLGALCGEINVPMGRLTASRQRAINILGHALGEAPLLILDEPTYGLSEGEALWLVAWLTALSRRRRLLVALPNLSHARRLGERIILLMGGKVLAHAETATVLSHPPTAAAREYLRTGSSSSKAEGLSAAVDSGLAELGRMRQPVRDFQSELGDLSPTQFAELGAWQGSGPAADPLPAQAGFTWFSQADVDISTPTQAERNQPLVLAPREADQRPDVRRLADDPAAPQPRAPQNLRATPRAPAISQERALHLDLRDPQPATSPPPAVAPAPAQPGASGRSTPTKAPSAPVIHGVDRTALAHADALAVGNDDLVDHRGPAGFRWVVPGKLALCALPGADQALSYDLDLLCRAGVSTLISLCEHSLPAEALARCGLQQWHVPVARYTAPSPKQGVLLAGRIQQLLQDGHCVAVHGHSPAGRAATAVAAWMVVEGALSAADTVRRLRRLDPAFIQSPQQEAYVLTLKQRARG